MLILFSQAVTDRVLIMLLRFYFQTALRMSTKSRLSFLETNLSLLQTMELHHRKMSANVCQLIRYIPFLILTRFAQDYAQPSLSNFTFHHCGARLLPS